LTPEHHAINYPPILNPILTMTSITPLPALMSEIHAHRIKISAATPEMTKAQIAEASGKYFSQTKTVVTKQAMLMNTRSPRVVAIGKKPLRAYPG